MRRPYGLFCAMLLAALGCASSQSPARPPSQDDLKVMLRSYARAWERKGTSGQIMDYETRFRRIIETPLGAVAVRGAIDELQAGWKSERAQLLQQITALSVAGRAHSPDEARWLRAAPVRIEILDGRGRRLRVLRGKLFPVPATY